MERAGGIVRAALAERKRNADEQQASGARYQLFLAPRRGMGSLVDALAAKLPPASLRLHNKIESIAREGEEYLVQVAGSSERFDAAIVACGAPAAARLLAGMAPSLAEKLAAIEQASSIVVARGYKRAQIAHPLDAFGLVVPIVEKRQVLAVSFSSVKFAGRAPEGSVLLRVFLGGAVQPALNDLDDAEASRLVDRELADLLGAEGPPEVESIVRWREAMPQYTVGHLDRLAKIDALAAELPSLQLAGNSFRGVGIPLCIRDGERAAERIVGRIDRP
jgi:oxygen-dependent protoporphyrinogen oxidase